MASKARSVVGGIVMGAFLLLGAFSLVLPIAAIFTDGSDSAESSDYLPFLGEAEATELAGSLAAASRQQSVCYGWRLTVDLPDRTDHVERGSSAGPGTRVDPAACPRWLVLDATVVYTSESSESEDSANFQALMTAPEGSDRALQLSNFAEDAGDLAPGAPATTPVEEILSGYLPEDWTRLGLEEEDFLGDLDDVSFFNAVASLPVLAAEEGLAAPVAVESNTRPLPADDHLTNRPDSDYLRQNLGALIFFAVWTVLCFGGMALLLVRRSRNRRGTNSRRSPRKPAAGRQRAEAEQPRAPAEGSLGKMERLAAEERPQRP